MSKKRQRKNYKNPGDSLDFIMAPFFWIVGWIERRLKKKDQDKEKEKSPGR